MNPTNGRWFPAKAFGVGKFSLGASFSTSSKLRVSSSPLSSCTIGGTQLRMVANVHWSFLKKRCERTSSAPLKPSRDNLDEHALSRYIDSHRFFFLCIKHFGVCTAVKMPPDPPRFEESGP